MSVTYTLLYILLKVGFDENLSARWTEKYNELRYNTSRFHIFLNQQNDNLTTNLSFQTSGEWTTRHFSTWCIYDCTSLHCAPVSITKRLFQLKSSSPCRLPASWKLKSWREAWSELYNRKTFSSCKSFKWIFFITCRHRLAVTNERRFWKRFSLGLVKEIVHWLYQAQKL